jgi:hypothetical protein
MTVDSMPLASKKLHEAVSRAIVALATIKSEHPLTAGYMESMYDILADFFPIDQKQRFHVNPYPRTGIDMHPQLTNTVQ